MSRSLYNNNSHHSGCNGCCSSRSLYPAHTPGESSTSTASLLASLNTLISQGTLQIAAASILNNSLTTLAVSGTFTSSQTAVLNQASVTLLTVGQAGTTSLQLTNNTISSPISNIVLAPYNPTTDTGEVTIQDNMSVYGSYANLCTSTIYMLDSVPKIGICSGGTSVIDTNDRGLDIRYADVPGITQYIGFMGYDKSRQRFVTWRDTTFGISSEQYERTGTLSNDSDIDVLYTYMITNPNDPNAPSVLNGLSKSNVVVQATNEFDTTSLDQNHNIGMASIHTVGLVDPSQSLFSIIDASNSQYNFIQLSNDASQATGIGLFAYHSSKIELNTSSANNNGIINILSNGSMVLSSDIGQINITANGNNKDIILSAGGTMGQVQIQPELAVDIIGGLTSGLVTVNDNLVINGTLGVSAGFVLQTNILTEINSNLVISTTTDHDITISSNADLLNMGNTIQLISNNVAGSFIQLTTTYINPDSLTDNGYISIESSGSQNITGLASGSFPAGVYINSQNGTDIVLNSSSDMAFNVMNGLFIDTIADDDTGFIQLRSSGFQSIIYNNVSHNIGALITSNNGNDITLNASNGVVINPAIEFVQSNTNPGIVPTQTIFYGSVGPLTTIGARTRFNSDDKLYVLSDEDLNFFPADINNSVVVYSGGSGHLIKQTSVFINGNDVHGINNLRVHGNTHLGSGTHHHVTIHPETILNAINPNNDLVANNLAFNIAGTVTAIPTDIITQLATGDMARMMFLNDSISFEIQYTMPPTSDTQILQWNGTNVSWTDDAVIQQISIMGAQLSISQVVGPILGVGGDVGAATSDNATDMGGRITATTIAGGAVGSIQIIFNQVYTGTPTVVFSPVDNGGGPFTNGAILNISSSQFLISFTTPAGAGTQFGMHYHVFDN